MNLNLTILGQMITFALFIWFTMKFVWPAITNAMEERQTKIADGLAAAEQGQKELELANYKTAEMLTEAKAKAAGIIEQANSRANRMIEDSKDKAREEGDRLLVLAKEDISKEYVQAKEELISQVGRLAVAGAEKILQREIGANADLDHQIISDLIGEA
jgi:F-type H+-transporting ATPase subunit b